MSDFLDELTLKERAKIWYQQHHVTVTEIFGIFSLKEKVYLQRSFQVIDHIERIIREACKAMTPDMIRNVIKKFNQRTITCLERDDGYIEVLIKFIIHC